MKIRYSLLPTLMVSLFSYPVYSATTVTTYQGLLDALSSSTTADVVLDMNGSGIDLDGADGVTISQNQSVLFKNIGTKGSSSWTDTSFNITNYGYISIDNVIFKENYFQSSGGAGGAVIDNRGKIDNIKAIFIDSHLNSSQGAYGGAIYNNKGTINNITGDFTGNYSYGTQGTSYGGAIYNSGTIGDITSSFTNNYTKSDENSADGGAIYNYKGTINNITGDFTGNYIVSNNGHSYGGAIYNSGTIGNIAGSFTNNYAKSEGFISGKIMAGGGAIYNNKGTINNITGDFTGNYSYGTQGTSYGGAIVNYEGTIGDIAGSFINNYNKSDNNRAYGGAINNKGTIGDITGNFINNYAISETGEPGGGAIMQLGNSTITVIINSIIGNFTNNYTLTQVRSTGGAINNNSYSQITNGINGNFVGNYAKSTGDNYIARGGAIVNVGYIKHIIGDFTDNYVDTAGTGAIGGALMNLHFNVKSLGIDKVQGTFTNNHASALGVNGYAQGGAIYNKAGASASYMGISSSTFNNNYVKGILDTTDGGAIWNDGTIDFSGNNYFSGNYKVVNGTKSANDIYNAGTINMLAGSMLDITGGISGSNGVINAGENSTLNLYTSQAEGNNMIMSDGASMLIEINNITTDSTTQSGGKFAGDITLNGTNTLIVQANLNSSALNKTGEYQFANNVDSSVGSWDLQYTDNGLYNYNLAMTEDSNKNKLEILYERKTTDEISESLNISKEEAEEIIKITEAESDNDLFNELRQEIDRNAQNKTPNIGSTLADMKDNPMANISVMHHIEDLLLKVVNQRISSRQNQMNIGLSGGDFDIKNPNMWVSGLYNKSKNDGDLNYETNSYGVVTGVDFKLSRRLMSGFGYSYIQSDMESNNKKIDIDTHSIFGYGEYTRNDWFANLYASYNMFEFSQDKAILNKVLEGEYDGEMYGAQLMLGKNLYDCPENHYLRLRPNAGLRYYHINQDGYTDNAGIKYDDISGDILTGVVGVELTDNMMIDKYPLVQRAYVNATYDLVNDNVSTYMELPNGNGYSVGEQAEDEFGIEAGYGVEVELTDNLSAGVNYEFDWHKNYTSNTGFINLKYSF